jgi:hypothetical protein
LRQFPGSGPSGSCRFQVSLEIPTFEHRTIHGTFVAGLRHDKQIVLIPLHERGAALARAANRAGGARRGADLYVDCSSEMERRAIEKRYLGYAQSAFFGGRTSAHIRKVPVPVVYTDFLSMYPTVNALMGLWKYLVAEEVSVVPGDVSETVDFLHTITPEKLFDPQTWTRLPAFARVIPDGDILPTRATYSVESNDYQVALNHLYASSDDPKDGLWYALPDLAASVLLTGRVPTIVDAFAIKARGTLRSLRKITLRGTVPIDPSTQDFFRTVIEERKRLANNPALSDEERKRLDKALKVLANATSYGIFAEMRREEALKDVPVTCYGIDPDPFTCKARNPERPGEYCFPPLASLITDAARRPDRMRRRHAPQRWEARDPGTIVGASRRDRQALRSAEPLRSHGDPGLGAEDRGGQLRSEDRAAAAVVVPGDFRQALHAFPS